MGLDLPKYLVLFKITPKEGLSTQANVSKALLALPRKPCRKVTVHYRMKVFGDWDYCVLFEADDHDRAMDFVEGNISAIDGVNHTYTLPMTPIKEHLLPASMQQPYILFLRVERPKTRSALSDLRALPKKPMHGITLHTTVNVFGQWDVAILFEATNTDQAMDFTKRKIRSIPGVSEFNIIPASLIK